MRSGFVTVTVLMLAFAATADEPGKHWAFVPPKRPPVPTGGHPIDAFLSIERQKHGLTPRPAADKRTLLRRIYLDLVGVPPTVDELETFLADSSSNAYEK